MLRIGKGSVIAKEYDDGISGGRVTPCELDKAGRWSISLW